MALTTRGWSMCACLALLGLAYGAWGLPSAPAEDEKPAQTASSEEAEAPHGEQGETARPHDAQGGEHGHESGGGGHGGENEFDLSHANAGPAQGSIVELKQDAAIYTFIVFLLLLAIVTKFAWRPIMEGLAKRESSIAKMIDEAKENQAKTQEALKQYEARLAAAAEEARQMVAQARLDAEAAKEKIVAEAQAAAQREREKSLAEIRAAKEAALREMAQQSVDTAFALAGRVIRKEIRPADHSALIAESLAQFPSKN